MTPTAIGGTGLGATGAGGILSAFGSAAGGIAQKNTYDYQSRVATLNAQIDKQNQEYAYNQGEVQATQYGERAAQQRGGIIAAQGASGIQIGTGSSANVVASQGKITALDLGQIRSNAAKTAYDFDVKSSMDTDQANLDTLAGKNAETSGFIGAASSILGSVGSVSNKWLQGNSTGLWGTNSSGSFSPVRSTMGLDGLNAIT